MLINNIEEFVKCIPTASGSEWDALLPYVETAQMDMTLNLLGAELNTALIALDATNTTRQVACKLLAVAAYHTAIPFVDLSQTANGFAVVSNSNLAPASKERVERLITWCEMQIDKLTDMLISLIYNDAACLAKWKLHAEFANITDCLFLTGSEFAYYARIKESAKRTIFLQEKAQLKIWLHNVIAPVVSEAYLAQLIERNATKTVASGDVNIISNIKLALAALWNNDNEAATRTLNNIGTVLDNNLATYSIYATSDEYRLKHAVRDVNKADHPTFFMGI